MTFLSWRSLFWIWNIENAILKNSLGWLHLGHILLNIDCFSWDISNLNVHFASKSSQTCSWLMLQVDKSYYDLASPICSWYAWPGELHSIHLANIKSCRSQISSFSRAKCSSESYRKDLPGLWRFPGLNVFSMKPSLLPCTWAFALLTSCYSFVYITTLRILFFWCKWILLNVEMIMIYHIYQGVQLHLCM